MNAYDKNQTAQFGVQLVKREAELKSLLRASASRENHSDDATMHEVSDFKDMADEEASAVVDEFQIAHAAQELQQIAAARLRLDRCEFGHCQDCGQVIGLSRLSAVPSAARCVACQALEEDRVRAGLPSGPR